MRASLKVEHERAVEIAKRLKMTQFTPTDEYLPTVLSYEEVQWLLDRAKKVFMTETTLLEIEPPVNICGDTHGQFNHLLRLFKKAGWPPKHRYLFLDDYVDRGPNSVEVIGLVLAYKVAYPSDFYLLRGNHDAQSINRVYGFYDEMKNRYDTKLWAAFNATFDCMPVAALVGSEMFCMHGGISPTLTNFDQIRQLKRPMKVPDEGLVCDLLWADPDPKITGYEKSTRGVSYLFGADVAIQFCEQMSIAMVIRAHQVSTFSPIITCARCSARPIIATSSITRPALSWWTKI